MSENLDDPTGEIANGPAPAERRPGYYWVRINGDDGKPLAKSTPEPAEWDEDGHWYCSGSEVRWPRESITVLSDRLEPPHG
jgi:hypothetical protein